jgi:hypothetical protein
MKAEDLYHRQIALLRQKSDRGSRQREQHRTNTDRITNMSKTPRFSNANRKASFSENERVFLHALLVENSFAENTTVSNTGKEGNRPVNAKGEISDDILFSVPAPLLSEPELHSSTASGKLSSAAPGDAESGHRASAKHHSRGSSAMQIGLWRAHEDGVPSAMLREVNQKVRQATVGKEAPPQPHIPEPVFHDAIDEHIGEIIDTTRSMTLNDDDVEAANVVKSLCNTIASEARNRQVSEPALREEDEQDVEATEAMMALAKDHSQKGGNYFAGLAPVSNVASPEKEVGESTALLVKAAVFIENEPTIIPSDAKREGLIPEGADMNTEAESCRAQLSHMDEADTIRSDEEVRQNLLRKSPGRAPDDRSENSSWGEHEGGFVHYDAWQVLKDEYAQDFGFCYREDADDNRNRKQDGEEQGLHLHRNDSDNPVFKILGTSANDRSAQPQVMSPPLLESLMSFVPDHLSNKNLWLKYSLVRDGASIYSLRDHCKKSQHTFMALETKQGKFKKDAGYHSVVWKTPPDSPSTFLFLGTTYICLLAFITSTVADTVFVYKHDFIFFNAQYTKCAIGDVLGSFTSTPWHKTTSYYGTGESFLWKMRHSRMTNVHSLLEQAELESEVDIFPFSGLNYYIQLCTHDKLAVGGGSLIPPEATKKGGSAFDVLPANALERLTGVAADDDFGFGIAVNGDMSRGTTSPCATFRNPSLVSHSSKTESFEIVNLEVWTFTPCETVEDAIQVEDMKYDRAVSYRATGSLTSTSNYSNEIGAGTQSMAELLRSNPGSGVSYH